MSVDWQRVQGHTVKAADVGTLLVLGGAAFVGSARHVLRLAETHGQAGTSAWLIAGSVEVLAAYCGWEARRRDDWRRWVPMTVLVAAAGFIVAANLASAEDTAWGYVLAVVPAVVFLAVVAVAETKVGRKVRRRQGHQPVKPQVTAGLSLPVVPVGDRPVSRPTLVPAGQGVSLDEWVTAQRDAGTRRADVLRDGAARFGVSEKTVARRWDGAVSA